MHIDVISNAEILITSNEIYDHLLFFILTHEVLFIAVLLINAISRIAQAQKAAMQYIRIPISSNSHS